MTMDLEVLKCGNCEELKAGVHAAALGLFVVMGAYNVAAWLSRRPSMRIRDRSLTHLVRTGSATLTD